jgi:preprotein translocase subunit SecG
MLFTLVTILHVAICLFLIVVVLLQSGKAADLAGAFGGMGSQTAFGPRGSATLLSKATTASAVLFMVTSLSLSIMATRRSGGVSNTILEKHPAPAAPKPAGSTATLPTNVPGAPVRVTPSTGSSVQPGQPSVTLTDPGTGATHTVPLTIPPPPGGAPAQQQAPAKK